MVTRQLSPLVYCNENQLSGNSNFVRSRTNPDICLHFPRYTPTHRHFQRIYIIQTMVAFFLACEDFGRMFDNSFTACAFFFKLEICFRTLIYPNDARPLIHPPIPTSQNPHPSLSLYLPFRINISHGIQLNKRRCKTLKYISVSLIT